MTRDESLAVVGLIVNSWPGPSWDADRIDAYAYAIEGLEHDPTERAVKLAIKTLKFRPSVAELREFVRMTSRPEEVRDPVPFIRDEKPVKPEWVLRWQRARHADDWRPFPEQQPGYKRLAIATPEDQDAYAFPQEHFSDREKFVQPDEYLEGPEGEFPIDLVGQSPEPG